MERLHAHGWEVVRRVTGGRAILHTDELTDSVTGSADEPVLAGGVLESYNRLAQALLHAVRELSVPVEMKEHEDGHTQQNLNPVCFEVPSTYEITVDGKKLIGSAQARKKEGVLQHGSLPLNGDFDCPRSANNSPSLSICNRNTISTADVSTLPSGRSTFRSGARTRCVLR